MIEQAIPAAIAIVTGGTILIKRGQSRIHTLDRRLDNVELRMVENYVSKKEFGSAMLRMEGHLVRMEEKLDRLVEKIKI